MKPKTLLPFAFLLAISSLCAGCSKSGEEPAYLAPEERAKPPAAAPDVEAELARETGVERIIARVGPVDLPAGEEAGGALAKPITMKFQTDREVWVTGFIPRVVDANGGELPAELLHHAIVFNLHEENPLCAGRPNPVAVATSMLTKIELPEGYGYPLLPEDPLELEVVLLNGTEKGYSGVSFELTIVARRMSSMASVRDVQPLLLELDPCGHKAMEVEPNVFAERSATYAIPAASSLVLAQGVLQDHGSAVQLTSGEEAEPFWRAEALLDEGHRLRGLADNPFEDPAGIPFKAGDQITAGFAYDNLSEGWLKGATAGAMIYLAGE